MKRLWHLVQIAVMVCFAIGAVFVTLNQWLKSFQQQVEKRMNRYVQF